MFSPERLLEYGPLGLFLVAFFESTVFPIPPDVLLLPLCLMTPRLSWWYAFLATSASVTGALLGYFIGRKAGRPVVLKFISKEMVDRVQVLFGKYGGWAVGVAAFTPLPYKVFTFGAGIFRVPLLIFAIASTLGRSARFFLVGAMVFFLGDRARIYLGRNFEIATLAVTGLLLVAVAFYPKIDSYLRARRNLERTGRGNLSRAASGAGIWLRSVKLLGVRVLAGLTASTVLFLLAVVYLGDLSGPEQAVLNRSLLPFYEWYSGVTCVPWLWSFISSAWLLALLVVAGILRFIMWNYFRQIEASQGPYFDGHKIIRARITSSIYSNLARLGLLAVVTYVLEIGLSSYLLSVYGSTFSPPPGHALLTPYLIVFGTYLLSKGILRSVQIPLIGLMVFLSGGNSAYIVLTESMDAAAATASILVSVLMLAVSYTVLAIRTPTKSS